MTTTTASAPRASRPAAYRALGALGWSAIVAAVLIFVPIAAVLSNVFSHGGETWKHLVDTVLPGYVANTALLVLGVAYGVVSIGVLSAWLVTAYRFPGRQFLQWALILPLAMPAYVMAYAYTDWLQFTGPVQTWLRELTGWRAREYWFPEIRSLGGAMAVLSFALYPYVYLLARASFLDQSRAAAETARLLGYGPWGTFFRVALPLARPGIVAGTALALMEALADFGTVSYFAVQTFTTGIYRAWLSLGDTVAAGQLASCLLAFVALVLVAERISRGKARYHNVSARARAAPQPLHGFAAAAAFAACFAPLLFGFLLPVGILAELAWEEGAVVSPRLVSLIGNTFTLAGITAVLAIVAATLMAYAGRVVRSPVVTAANRIAALGYAIPGAVIAVGILVPLGKLDNALADWLREQFGMHTGLLLTGTIVALVYAYLVRFLAIAFQSVEAGLARITPSMDDAARSLGAGPAATLARVHAPMLWSSLLVAGLLVFVDVMKELPATFAMRPFNFDTLAVEIYNLTKDERLGEAAAPSLVIVAIGLIPLIVLSRQMSRSRGPH
ncbi:MAG: ABC transporter permease subunit [Betaproteobacteria bacterium]|nr:ABC transporter permease subunit [Betaproteobacteria bacterium]